MGFLLLRVPLLFALLIDETTIQLPDVSLNEPNIPYFFD